MQFRMNPNFEKQFQKDFEKRTGGKVQIGATEKETRENYRKLLKKAGVEATEDQIRKKGRELHKKGTK